MIRRKGRFATRVASAASEDVDPNSSLTNLADCMLVLAVGLLVALVAHYNVNLQEEQQIITGNEIVMDVNEDGVVDENFSQYGTVYYDKETGDYYMVNE